MIFLEVKNSNPLGNDTSECADSIADILENASFSNVHQRSCLSIERPDEHISDSFLF